VVVLAAVWQAALSVRACWICDSAYTCGPLAVKCVIFSLCERKELTANHQMKI